MQISASETGNGSNQGGFIAPAIVLYFLESKANAQTTQAVIQTVADVASLAIPGAGAYKLITYADKVSSVMSIAGSYYQNDNPELAKYLNLTSSILGISSLTLDLTTVNSIKNVQHTDDAVAVLNQNGANFNQYLNADQSANVLTFKERIDRAINPASSNLTNTQALERLDDIDVLSVPESKNFVINTIENEIAVAKAGNNTTDVISLEYTLSKVKNFGPSLNYTFHNFYKALENKTSNWFNKNFYKTSGKNNVVAAVEPQGLVIHQATPKNQIPDNATLVAVVENTEYKMLQDGDFTFNADVYIYDDGGNMKVFCLGSGNCFTENTDISTMHGTKRIADVEVGDSVLSYDEGTQHTVYSRVKKLFKKNTASLVRLIAGADTLWTTPDHRFLTKTGWKTARNLVVGASLITANGTLAVEDVQLKDSISEVYNFEVENTHTYIVGTNQLVVHNDCQSTVNALLNSDRINPDDVTSFIGDFQNSSALLAKFESGELSVDAWRVLSEGGSSLKTSEEAIKFFKRIDDSPALSNKLLNDLDDTELASFVDDFGDISSANRADFDGNVELVESWKVLINGNPKLRTLENATIVDSYKTAANASVSYAEIQSAFDGLKASRRPVFLNGLAEITNNNLGLTNARLATPSELQSAIVDLRTYRSGNASLNHNSNIGKLEGNVNGVSVSNYTEHNIWVGGQQNILTPRPTGQPIVWQASNAQTSNGYDYFADVDSEFNMLTDLVRKLEPNAVSTSEFLNYTGELRIVSEISYCTSCQGIIQKFNQMFPNIQIILIDGIK